MDCLALPYTSGIAVFIHVAASAQQEKAQNAISESTHSDYANNILRLLTLMLSARNLNYFRIPSALK